MFPLYIFIFFTDNIWLNAMCTGNGAQHVSGDGTPVMVPPGTPGCTQAGVAVLWNPRTNGFSTISTSSESSEIFGFCTTDLMTGASTDTTDVTTGASTDTTELNVQI